MEDVREFLLLDGSNDANIQWRLLNVPEKYLRDVNPIKTKLDAKEKLIFVTDGILVDGDFVKTDGSILIENFYVSLPV